jgi:hypothetical protein
MKKSLELIQPNSTWLACLAQKNHTSKVLPYHDYAEHKLNHTDAFAKRKQKIEQNTQEYK